jgi:hypothetical protein
MIPVAMENSHDDAVAATFDLLDNTNLRRFTVPWRTTTMIQSRPSITMVVSVHRP